MDNEPRQADAGQSGGPQFREAFDRLVQIVLDGTPAWSIPNLTKSEIWLPGTIARSIS